MTRIGVPAVEPPRDLVEAMMNFIRGVLAGNPMITGSEKHLEAVIEQHFLRQGSAIRIGINYHGQTVQLVNLNRAGNLIGWNPDGDVFARGANNKMIMRSNNQARPGTIIDRDDDEHGNTDTKIQNGRFLDPEDYVRVEHKVRGWLGKTRNLDGEQFMKDIALLLHDQADLLHWSLSEAAYRKFRGEGPRHQAERRSGTEQFFPLLPPDAILERNGGRMDFYATIGGDYTWRKDIVGTPLCEGETTTFDFPVYVSVAKADTGESPPMQHCVHYIVMIHRQVNELRVEASQRSDHRTFEAYYNPGEHTEGTIFEVLEEE